jgi:hypothetical protein
MRTRHALAVVVVLLTGLAIKQYFYPPVVAEADISTASTMNVSQMHANHPNPPAQKMHDMTFVFDGE